MSSNVRQALPIGHNFDERLMVAKGVPFLEREAHSATAAGSVGDALKEVGSGRMLITTSSNALGSLAANGTL